MNEQTVDLRRALRIIRRYIVLVLILTGLGLVGGVGYTVLKPPLVSSDALVELSTQSNNVMATQVVLAGSDPVLSDAMRRLGPGTSLLSLQNMIKVKSLTPSVMSITAKAKKAAEAERMANTVAGSYLGYVRTTYAKAGKLQARLLQPAIYATGPSIPFRTTLTALLGAIAGLLVGAVVALAVGRGDKRLRLRDEIADAIGVPVLASLPVVHAASARQWSGLLESYEPNAEHAWRMRSALRYLGLPDVIAARTGPVSGRSLTVLSISADRHAVALGPQLAVFAASCGLPTALVVSAQQDEASTEALRAACSAPPSSSRRTGNLRIVNDESQLERIPAAALTVVVAVVDGRAPKLDDAMRTSATVLGVSAGAATAEQLARVAVCAASNGRSVDGILVADPDPADSTTGRIPQMVRPVHRLQPTRAVGPTTEARRRVGEAKL